MNKEKYYITDKILQKLFQSRDSIKAWDKAREEIDAYGWQCFFEGRDPDHEIGYECWTPLVLKEKKKWYQF